MRAGLGLLVLIVVTALAGCGAGSGGGTAGNAERFREGRRTLDRLDAMPGAKRQGRDSKAVLGDDGAPGETVRGATRQWRLHGRFSSRDVLAHYARQMRGLGYAPGTRRGDKSSHHENWVRGAACIEVLTGNGELIITAAPRCVG
jgi:hypothetical protein